MSDPSRKQNVEKIIALVIREAVATEKVMKLTGELARVRNDHERAIAERNEATASRTEQMTAMDLMPRGNYGHEARMGMFLAELVRQTINSRGEPQ